MINEINAMIETISPSLDSVLPTELIEKVKRSIEILKLAGRMSERYYNKPLIICYSGGKDSDVLADLAIRSGVNIEMSNSHTTIDAPETVYHIRRQFDKWRAEGIPCVIRYPMYKGKRTSMWDLIVQHGSMPSPWGRYCCETLKENNEPRRFIATGIRKSESAKRAQRNVFEWLASRKEKYIGKSFEETAEVYQEDVEDSPYGDCKLITAAKHHRKLCVNPLIEWTDEDVWKYIKKTDIAYNPLYDEGFKRIGCIGCPLTNTYQKRMEFNRWPKYEKLYRQACQKMIDEKKREGKDFMLKTKDGQYVVAKDGNEVFDWWFNIRSYSPKSNS